MRLPNLDPNASAEPAQLVRASIEALERRDFAFFARHLPRREHWRMYESFRDSFAFLDIETTGLSRVYHKLTVVGIYSSDGYRAYIDGHNLDGLQEAMSRFPLIVTFNGSLFDLPFIREKYPDVCPPVVHIDLRFLLRRIGLSGPLKSIEKCVGIQRDAEVDALTGFDATVLWSQYTRGDKDALSLLVKYNVEDTVNLKVLMDLAFVQLSRFTCPWNGVEPSWESVRQPAVSFSTLGVNVDNQLIRTKSAPKKRVAIEIGDLLKLARGAGYDSRPRIVGIDLTGSEARPSGWAFLRGRQVDTARIKTDEDLVRLTIEARPSIVSIDSPLSLPVGWTTIDEGSPGAGISRDCERYLKRVGISVYWCLLPSMKQLTARGIRLASRLRAEGMNVIESFPGAAQDILQVPRKKTSLVELKQGLRQFGIKGSYEINDVSHDELDAITCALVGLFYIAGKFEALGNPQEDYLIVPRIREPQRHER